MRKTSVSVATSFLAAALLFQTEISAETALGVDDRFDRFSRAEQASQGQDSRTRAETIGSSYDRNFGDLEGGALKQRSDEELALLFRASNIATFYTMRDADLERMVDTYDELRHRGRSDERQAADLYGALVSMRRFDAARRLIVESKAQNIEELPAVIDHVGTNPALTTLLEPSADGSMLHRRKRSIERGPAVVIVSHPLCHFSSNAVRAIEADPALAALILDRAIWLAPPDRHIYPTVLADWNRAHPRATVAIAYRRDEWQAITSWGTPTFYFLRDGKRVATVSGWPQEGRRAELLRAAKEIGLATP